MFGWYRPFVQSSHVRRLATSSADCPSVHLLHGAPLTSLYFPGKHGKQASISALPVLGAYLPLMQPIQADTPLLPDSLDHFPEPQAKQSSTVRLPILLEYLPGKQSMQSEEAVARVCDCHVPATQSVQAIANWLPTPIAYFPAAHSIQSASSLLPGTSI